MKKKVLIDLERLRYPNSGIARVFRNIAKGIWEHSTALEIEIFGPEEEISKEKLGFRIKPRMMWHKFLEGFSCRYDIIHVSHQFSSYFRKNYKSAFKIVTLHDLNFLHEDLSTDKRQKYLDRVNKTLMYADHIVCISNFVREDFIKHKHLFDLKKLKGITTIYNGLKFPSKEKKYSRIIKRKYSKLQDKEYILNIGVLFPKKNQISLVNMLSYTDLHLVLVVSDVRREYEDLLFREIERLNLQNRVHIYKNISNNEKNFLLENCKTLCHPSLAEGFGIPPVEAMYFGKPVFLSTLTSLPEVGGDSAFYFEDFDPKNMAKTLERGLEHFENNPKLKQKMVEWANQFDYRVTSKRYLDLYQKLLS